MIAPVAPGTLRVKITAGDQSADAAVLVAYPARYDFSRADPATLLEIAAASGGAVLSPGAPIATAETRWMARPGWGVWALLALALLMADLVVRHAHGLLQRRRRERPPPDLALAA